MREKAKAARTLAFAVILWLLLAFRAPRLGFRLGFCWLCGAGGGGRAARTALARVMPIRGDRVRIRAGVIRHFGARAREYAPEARLEPKRRDRRRMVAVGEGFEENRFELVVHRVGIENVGEPALGPKLGDALEHQRALEQPRAIGPGIALGKARQGGGARGDRLRRVVPREFFLPRRELALRRNFLGLGLARGRRGRPARGGCGFLRFSLPFLRRLVFDDDAMLFGGHFESRRTKRFVFEAGRIIDAARRLGIGLRIVGRRRVEIDRLRLVRQHGLDRRPFLRGENVIVIGFDRHRGVQK